MKLNLYTFASLFNNATPETTMFGIMVATKLSKEYDRIEKCIDKHNPKTLSALLQFALSNYDEFMTNLHSDIDVTDKRYYDIYAEYCGRIRSLCDWENDKKPISTLITTLTMRDKKGQTEQKAKKATKSIEKNA